MAKILNFPNKLHGHDFDVSSGTSPPVDHRSILAKTSTTLDQWSESSVSSRYNAETIIGLPSLIKEISDIYDRCQVDNWDGDGATSIPLAAYMHALQLLSNLPIDLPLPSTHPDSDGHLELEWYHAGKTFSILIGARPLLFWAGYYSHNKRRSGREPFEGILPMDLTFEIKKVYA